MIARRPPVQTLPNTPKTKGFHLGLWLDKYLKEQYIVGEHTAGSTEEKQAKSARSSHLKEAEKPPIPEGYKEAYERWEQGLKEVGCHTTIAKVEGRMIVGLGDKNPLEIGITLQHTWGVPYIPGSALKGLASATAARLIADKDWQRTKTLPTDEKSSADILFGDTEQMGRIIFHDAWWIPNSPHVPIHLDVMTVHHPEYYQKAISNDLVPPSDTDSPNPVSFLSTNGSYLIALEGDPVWCKAAYDLLEIGLTDLGVGAKTHSGYGRLRLGELEDNAPLTPEKWAEQTYPDAPNLAPEAQYKQLLALQKAPSYPPSLQEGDCKRALSARFDKGIVYAQKQTAAQGPSADELQQQLAEKEANPPPKSEKTKRNRWKDEIDQLKKRIATAGKNTEQNQKNQKEAQDLLAWLGIETA